jgi:hypothetical protein
MQLSASVNIAMSESFLVRVPGHLIITFNISQRTLKYTSTDCKSDEQVPGCTIHFMTLIVLALSMQSAYMAGWMTSS